MKTRFFHLCALLAGMMLLPGALVAVAPTLIRAQIVEPRAYLPLILRRAETPTTTPDVLASGQGGPNSLVVDSETVYWANCGTPGSAPPDGAIMAYFKSEGISQTLVSGLTCPTFLNADADSLFWLSRRWVEGNGEFIMFQWPKSGGQPIELGSYTAVNGSFAVDDTYVYWREDSGVVMRLSKTGGSAPQPAPVPALVFDGPDAYWLNRDGDLIRSDKDGNSAVTLVKASDFGPCSREPCAVYITGIIPRPSDIYYTVFIDNYPGWISCTDQHTGLVRIPKGGGEREGVAYARGRAATFVAEPFAFFSGDCTQGILKATLNSQTVEILAPWPERVSALADDANYIYWADAGKGWVKRIAK